MSKMSTLVHAEMLTVDLADQVDSGAMRVVSERVKDMAWEKFSTGIMNRAVISIVFTVEIPV